MTDARTETRMRTVEEVYGKGFDEYDAFEAALDESLDPRGLNNLMFEMVAALGLAPGSAALDVGAREGYHCIELARRFGFDVHGVEPLRSHLEGAARELLALADQESAVAARVRVEEGVAERLPVADASIDLVWCRDVLVHVEDLNAAFTEFHRVLRPGGHALVFQMTATEWLTPAEAERLWPAAGIHASSADPQNIDAAIAASGLSLVQHIELKGEIREFLEESGAGRSSRQLLWVSRLLRNRPAYEQQFGVAAYEVMLTDSLWGVYQMIGKLSPRLYLLAR
jgi:ubiquinone/menaquinone biosynthesis C-methylase UbiE